MQLAAGHDLSVSFVTRNLFSGLSFSVENNAHIGLVGINGCGKTTLLKLMQGLIKPDLGQVAYSKETKLAYMEQFLLADESMTLYQAVLAVFADLIALESQIAELNAQLEDDHSEAMLARQNRLNELYAALGGYTYQARLRSTLLGLGFDEHDFALPVAALSGGQRSKAALAKVLLTDANLLLLDEPTNHLDIDSIEWLENFLINYRGAFIIVSHDRYFLDKVTTETWTIEHGKMRCFSGNYSAHLLKKDSEDETLRRHYQNQLREIRRIEGIIVQQRRFNQERNYVTIASKQKQIERMKSGLIAPERDARALTFAFETPPPGGNDVLVLHQLSKAFGKKKLFAHLDMEIHRGERIFLLGGNGIGKTTLMKIIMGWETADSGLVKLGVNIKPAYYDQIQSHIRGSESTLTHMTNCYPRLTQTKLRTLLGSFLFPGDSVEKSIDSLSGGEKARLELLKLMIYPANFLLLDEPSNHLDIDSREAVENALLDYPGAMLVISHDRYLINRLADRIYCLGEQGLTESIGNYDDYLEMLQKGQVKMPAAFAEPKDKALAAEADAGAAAVEYKRRKEEQAEIRRIAKKKTHLKEEIAKLEKEIDVLDEQLDACAAEDYLLLAEFVAQKEQLENEMLKLMEDLEELKNLPAIAQNQTK